MLLLAVSVAPAIFSRCSTSGSSPAVQLFPALALYFFSRRERSALGARALRREPVAQVGVRVADHRRRDRRSGPVPSELAPGELAIGQVLIQFGVLRRVPARPRLAPRLARSRSRKMQQAMRLAAQREALLHEARAGSRARARASTGRAGSPTRRRRVPARPRDRPRRDGRGLRGGARRRPATPAAVKLLSQRAARRPARTSQRFLREVAHRARRSTRRTSCACSSVGRRPTPMPYLAMERLRGHDLARSPAQRAAMLAERAASSCSPRSAPRIDAAGAAGIVHRDLKPQNLFLADGGDRVEDARLRRRRARRQLGHADAGPRRRHAGVHGARAGARRARSITAPTSTRSPRSRTAGSPGARRSPGATCTTSLYQVVHVDAAPAERARRRSHADVDAVLAIGLAKDPAQRWQRASELAEALRRRGPRRARSARPPARRRRARRHPWGAVRG